MTAIQKPILISFVIDPIKTPVAYEKYMLLRSADEIAHLDLSRTVFGLGLDAATDIMDRLSERRFTKEKMLWRN